MINAFKLWDSIKIVQESENQTITQNFDEKVRLFEKTQKEIVPESENEKISENLDKKVIFEKTIFKDY